MSRADRVRLDDRLERKPLPVGSRTEAYRQPQPPGRCLGYDYFLSAAFAEGQERGRRAHVRNATLQSPSAGPKSTLLG